MEFKAIDRINITEEKKLHKALPEIGKDLTKYFEGLSFGQVKTILNEYERHILVDESFIPIKES